jgi:MoxR-like ATPase
MKISIGYPGRSAELDILDRHGSGDPLSEIGHVVTAAELRAMTAAAQSVHMAPLLRGYIVDIAETTRRHPALTLGMSTRAALALQRVSRVQAASVMRTYVTPDDVKALARPVLAHRLLVSPEAQLQGVTSAQVLDQILEAVPVPTTSGM